MEVVCCGVRRGHFHVEAGMSLQEAGIHRCLRCGTEQFVRQDERIPVCRNGHSVFEHRAETHEASSAE
jgi:hypothetical protein